MEYLIRYHFEESMKELHNFFYEAQVAETKLMNFLLSFLYTLNGFIYFFLITEEVCLSVVPLPNLREVSLHQT